MTTAKTNCRICISVLAGQGVRHAVCSPGSRNTPLLLALDDNKQIKKLVVIDERSAAFIALGIAQTTQEPVMLVCTSGTAMLNYAPAIAEAYYQGLPLVVVTADRPMYIIDQDDSQTLRQREALDNFVKHSYDIPDFDADDVNMCRYANRISNDAMITALTPRRGPVHINMQIDNPLHKSATGPFPPERIISFSLPDDILPKEEVKCMAEEFADKRILVVGGFMLPDAAMSKTLARLSTLGNVRIMHETIANIHLPGRLWTIDTVLSVLSEEEKRELRPDLVITFGGALVSRMLKEYLRNCGATEHWTLGHMHTTVDCFNSLTRRIEADPRRFLSMFGKYLSRAAKPSQTQGYSEAWKQSIERALKSHYSYVRKAPWSDLSAFATIFKMIPRNFNLQLSNGTSIRYAQLCMETMPHACHCNRGVSGIDGALSTAVGAAMSYSGSTLLITGDMSLSYDVGALSSRLIDGRLKIIVVSNAGGGIFRFIGSTRDLDCREEYFCAPPKLPVEALAKAYGFDYYEAADEESLTDSLSRFFKPSDAPAILEVKVDPETGATVLRNYFTER